MKLLKIVLRISVQVSSTTSSCALVVKATLHLFVSDCTEFVVDSLAKTALGGIVQRNIRGEVYGKAVECFCDDLVHMVHECSSVEEAKVSTISHKLSCN